MKALIVEDDPETRGLLVDLLEQRGHDVTAAAGAESAWEACQAESFALALIDWHLPGMDGLQLTRQLRSLPGGDSSVVVVMTGRERAGELGSILAAGADDFLPKPFTLDLLDTRLTIAERQVGRILDRKRAEEALAHQATHDALTELPNRLLLLDRLEQAILVAERNRTSLALMVMDLDRFKEVNDTLGHPAGDILLRQVGERLRHTVRAPDTVARLGGDEFGVVLSDADRAGAVTLARRVLQALQHPFDVEGLRLDVSASIGIAVFPLHGKNCGALLQRADVAMYVAKRMSSGYALYNAEGDEGDSSPLSLMGELRHAIDNNQLLLHYQPKLRIETAQVSGMEALVRWQHPHYGQLQPDRFIHAAERTGLIGNLTIWVVREALRQCRLWRARGFDLSVAVNLSPRGLHEPQFSKGLAEMIAACGANPSWLELEVTESAVMADPEYARETLTRLSRLGVRLAIDDFGTGYSSLAQLKRLPVQEIKIDKSLVIDMPTDNNDAAIVRSVINLGHDLGLEVVGEGIESQAAWDMLARLGCDHGQGFYIRRPSPAQDFEGWLRDSYHKPHPAA